MFATNISYPNLAYPTKPTTMLQLSQLSPMHQLQLQTNAGQSLIQMQSANQQVTGTQNQMQIQPFFNNGGLFQYNNGVNLINGQQSQGINSTYFNTPMNYCQQNQQISINNGGISPSIVSQMQVNQQHLHQQQIILNEMNRQKEQTQQQEVQQKMLMKSMFEQIKQQQFQQQHQLQQQQQYQQYQQQQQQQQDILLASQYVSMKNQAFNKGDSLGIQQSIPQRQIFEKIQVAEMSLSCQSPNGVTSQIIPQTAHSFPSLSCFSSPQPSRFSFTSTTTSQSQVPAVQVPEFTNQATSEECKTSLVPSLKEAAFTSQKSESSNESMNQKRSSSELKPLESEKIHKKVSVTKNQSNLPTAMVTAIASRIVLVNCEQRTEKNQAKKSRKSNLSNDKRENDPRNRSRFHNLTKLFLNSLLSIYTRENMSKVDVPIKVQDEVIQCVSRVKLCGRKTHGKVCKTDLFNHSHYNALFLKLTPESINLIKAKPKDAEIHRSVFNIDVTSSSITQSIIDQVNELKKSIFETTQYVLGNPVDSTSIRDEYWLRAIVGIRQLAQGRLVYRFQTASHEKPVDNDILRIPASSAASDAKIPKYEHFSKSLSSSSSDQECDEESFSP